MPVRFIVNQSFVLPTIIPTQVIRLLQGFGHLDAVLNQLASVTLMMSDALLYQDEFARQQSLQQKLIADIDIL